MAKLVFNAEMLAKSVGCKNGNEIVFEEYFEIRKSDGSEPQDPKFEYFKKKVLDHLAELERKENGAVSKSLDLSEWIRKSNFPVGTVRTWNGQKFKKITTKKWVRVYESESRGAKLSVAALRRKAAACKNSEELYQLCLENMERFRDKEGHPLSFMQEFSEYVSGLNDKRESGKITATENTTAKKEPPKNNVQYEGEYVLTSNGSKDFGEITPEISKIIGRQAGKVRLEVGYHDNSTGKGYGEKHIERDLRSEQLKQNGFDSARDFVETVSSNFDSVYKGSGTSLILSMRNSKNKNIEYIELKPSDDGDYWSVLSALVAHEGYLKNKTLLWSKPNNSVQSSEQGRAQTNQQKPPSAVSGNPDNSNIPQDGEKSNENKKGALRVLTGQETHDFIEKHKTSKINERVSLGEISNVARNRIKNATGLDVFRVILDSDSIRHAYAKKEHNLEPNDLDDMKDVIDTTTDISLSSDKNPQGNPIIIFKKQEANGVILCEEYRAGKKELELQTAYRIKKNRQPHGAGNNQLPANVLDATAPNPNIQQTGEKSSGKKGIESISTKYHSSKSIEGDEDEIYVGKETISGKWKLVEADAPSASHDEITFRKTEGFPATKSGGTVNDRDYEHDTAAQEAVLDMSADFDGRALGFDSPIVVTQDGVVTSGNNRTMSSKLAARKGTDTKYIEALKKRAKKFGFTADDVARFKHPRVVFETVHSGDYTTDEFAKYNESGKKAKSPIEKAVEVSKRMKTEVVENIASNISDFDTMGELYADRKASQNIFNTLIQTGIIQKTDLPQYFSDNSITENGKEFLETVLIGSVVNETNIRGLQGAKSLRQKLVRAIVPLVENKGMNGYSINNELNKAVNIAVQVATEKSKRNPAFRSVEEFSHLQDMFEPQDPVAIELAKKLDGRTQKEFAEFMLEMNGGLRPAANGEVDIFLGNTENKEDIVNRILNIKKTVEKALNRFFEHFGKIA